MSWRDALPKFEISQEAMDALGPVLLGQRFFNQGQYQEAEACFRRGLDYYPAGSGGRFLIYNKLGILYEKTGDLERAVETYEKSVQEGALTPFTYHRLSCLHLEAGRLPQALTYAKRGIKALKKARTNVPQEIYFWFVFTRLKRRITRRMPPSQRAQMKRQKG